MCAITSIPTTRLSNPFITQQVLAQIGTNQTNLFRVQSQLSTGRRLLAPSDDPAAASRAMALQSLLERKSIVSQSFATNQTYISTSEASVGGVASTISDLRAVALSVVGNNVSPAERDAATATIDQAINQLVDVGNQKFRDRYLFAGSQTLVQPFASSNNGIVYQGNDNSLVAFSDIDSLFQSNISGHQVFGGLSTPPEASADLNPVLTWDTRLADLRAGEGIRSGSIAVSDGTSTSVVNIAGAETIGDVARMLEAHPPGNRIVTARVTNRGLEVSLNGGNLSIGEVGGGTTAAALGIKRVNGIGPGPLVGDDLDPTVTLTTQLADVLGSRSRGYLASTGVKNDLIIEATTPGTNLNNVTIKYVDDNWFQSTSGITQGNEFAQYLTAPTAATSVLKFPGRPGLDNALQITATTPGAAYNNVTTTLNVRAVDGLGTQTTYNPATKIYSISVETGTTVGTMVSDINGGAGPFSAAITPSGSAAYVLSAADNSGAAGSTYLTGSDAGTLAIHIEAGHSTANDVIAAIAAEGTFSARLDPSEEGSDGTGTVTDSITDVNALAVTSGGSGALLDLTGLNIVSGSQTVKVDFNSARTVEDLLNAINGAGADVLASLNASRTGIEIRSRLSGANFSIGENGGTTATQLGVRTTTLTTPLNLLNGGAGVKVTANSDDFTVTSRNGDTFGISLTQGNAASARLAGPGANSGLVVSRTARGTAGNQFSVQIVDSGVGGGDAVALVGNTLRYNVDIAAGFTAQEAHDLLALNPTLSSQFNVVLDQSTDTTNNGGGNLAATGVVNLTGGKGAATTIGDVLDLINNNSTNLASDSPITARLVQTGNGIQLVNDGPPSGGTLTVTRAGTSSAAQDLGLIDAASSGSGTPVLGNVATATLTLAGANNDLVISAAGSGTNLNGVTVHFADDGVAGNNNTSYNAVTRTLTIDVDPATTTAQDVVDLLAGDPNFRATLTATDGGVTNNGSGLLAALPADTSLSGGTADVLTGVDSNPQQVNGIFSALIQLKAAIQSGDAAVLQRAIGALDTSSTNLSFARAELGTRLQALDVLQNRISQEDITLQGALSSEIDVDFVSAVSEMASRQASFDASLKVSAQISKTTLLDYI